MRVGSRRDTGEKCCWVRHRTVLRPHRAHTSAWTCASILITGFSGTARTTLCGAFVAAACERGEKTLFVSFDSYGSEVRRNLASVGIHLDRHIASGMLRMVLARAISGSAETYLARIRALAREHAARYVVVDPVSTWARSGKDLSEHGVAEHLIDWCKGEGITLMCTRLLDGMSSLAEGNAPLQISTLVDTWLHLSDLVQAGERNRGLAIIKSCGTAHFNQMRELVLSAAGAALADTCDRSSRTASIGSRGSGFIVERLVVESASDLRRADRRCCVFLAALQGGQERAVDERGFDAVARDG